MPLHQYPLKFTILDIFARGTTHSHILRSETLTSDEGFTEEDVQAAVDLLRERKRGTTPPPVQRYTDDELAGHFAWIDRKTEHLNTNIVSRFNKLRLRFPHTDERQLLEALAISLGWDL